MSYETKKQTLIRELRDANGDIALGKRTSNLFRPRNQDGVQKINVRHFDEVIAIDLQRQTAEVEGMIPYAKFVDATLEHGMLPTVVPELKSITVGGAATGLGIESSSFKYGLVHETIEEMEIVLGDGRVVQATPSNEHKNLFFGFPNSYGTLGYALKLKVKLVPAKKYVELTHIGFDDIHKYFKNVEKFCEAKEYDFVDGSVFSRKEMYITLGKFVDEAPQTSDYTYLGIYYKSIRKRERDYLKTVDYIWRWDTDWFWCSRHFFVQNPLLRLLLGRKFLNSTFYWKIMKFNRKWKFTSLLGAFRKRKPESVIQDIEVPVDRAAEFLNFFHEKIGILPIWVCPTRMYQNIAYPLYIMDPNKLYINFGFWDMIETTRENGYYNRKIEQKLKELGGKKSLYSTSYYSRREFWQLYNEEAYKKLKQTYDPKNRLQNLYQKCVL